MAHFAKFKGSVAVKNDFEKNYDAKQQALALPFFRENGIIVSKDFTARNTKIFRGTN